MAYEAVLNKILKKINEKFPDIAATLLIIRFSALD
jgi:hypothetical protein